MDDMKKVLFRSILLLLCSIACGYLFLVIVFCIPQNRIFVNLANSVSVLERDSKEEMIFGYPSSRLDVFTDGAMLNATLHTNDESVFKRAAACYQYLYDDLDREQAFITYFEPREPDDVMSYPRYWHGILVALKPAFLFFNYSDIRVINCLGQIAVVCFTVYAFVRKRLNRYIPAVFIMYLFLMPFTLPLSIQYSSVFYIGFVSLTLLIWNYDLLKEDNRVIYLFLMTGILTSYFDLLTYPVFTLGVPLTGYVLIRSGEDRHNISCYEKWTGLIACGVAWFAGYAGMWAGKILVSIPFFGMGSITDAFDNIGKRSVTGAAGEGITYMDALNANLFMYKNGLFKNSLIDYTVVVIITLLYSVLIKKSKFNRSDAFCFMCIMVIPFAWYLVTAEHAHVHAFMTYRNMAVSVFAYCVMIVNLIGDKATDDTVDVDV